MKENEDKITLGEENTTQNTTNINENQNLKEESELVEIQNSDENNDLDDAIEEKPKSKIMAIIGKIFNWISIIIIAILLIVVGWLTIDKYILKSKAPSIFGYSYFMVETGSMNGFDMKEGDLIFVHPADRYITGDIITFFENENVAIPTTHRIIGIDGDRFITKGDANPSQDSVLVSQDMIVGKVVKVIPNVGIFFSWIKNGGGLIYVITFICIIGIGIYIIKKE